jgi:hypothetical protein
MVARVQRFTALRVLDDRRVLLLDGQARRLGEGSREALLEFASTASPGVYRANWDGARLVTEGRGPSRLREGMPSRFVVSPVADQRGRFPKPGPPSPYESVRLAGVATLLTDARGEEIFEESASAVLAWDGASLVITPDASPAVASVAEDAVLRSLEVKRARILVGDAWPLVLINAVAGVVGISVEGRGAFPAEVRAKVAAVLTE